MPPYLGSVFFFVWRSEARNRSGPAAFCCGVGKFGCFLELLFVGGGYIREKPQPKKNGGWLL